MRFLSVCSGIEAASCAWHPLGWKAVAFSEIEPFPSAVLAARWPDVPNLGDMTQFNQWPDYAINILVGGTPCQSFSLAGLRKGLDDPRGNLMLTFGAIAARYRPEWLLWENVPGVLSSAGGADFASFLGLLTGQTVSVPEDGWQNSGIVSGIEDAYGLAYRVLDAQYAGVPQRRRRVFVVGHLGDWRRAAAVLFERHSLQGHSAPSRQAGKDVAGTIGTSFARRGYDDRGDTGGVAPVVCPTLRPGGNRTGGDRPPGTDVDTCESLVVAASLRTRRPGEGGIAGDDTHLVPTVSPALNTQSGSHHAPDTKAYVVTVPGVVAFSSKDHGADAGDIAPTLRSMGHDGSHANGGGQVAVCFDTTQITSKENRSNPKAGDPCHVLAAKAHAPLAIFQQSSMQGKGTIGYDDSGIAKPCKTQSDGQMLQHGTAVRRLTPRECERLQGFEDDYTLIPVRGKPAADGPRYKALGNSMAVPVIRWIGERIAMVPALTSSAPSSSADRSGRTGLNSESAPAESAARA